MGFEAALCGSNREVGLWLAPGKLRRGVTLTGTGKKIQHHRVRTVGSLLRDQSKEIGSKSSTHR